MASAKEHITADFAPDGSVKVEAHNYSGNSCEQATSFLEKALGIVGARKKKPEYYKATRKVVNKQRLGAG